MRSLIRLLLIAALAAALFGCSSGNSGGLSVVDSSGNHPADWVFTHWDAYNNSPGVAKSAGKTVALGVSACAECHGSDLLNPQSGGGISRVSCFSASRNGQMCHDNGNGKLGHPTGWGDSPGAAHGLNGAMAAPAMSSGTGFGYCAKCHGDTYTNGKAVSCQSCHTTAPHPAKPWHGTTATGTNHVLTDPGNAAECAKCHTNGANFGPQIGTPAPAGTAPGCFNNTLCHDYGHSSYAPGAFSAAAAHGPAAKAALQSCRSCHSLPIAGPNPRFNVAKNPYLPGGCEGCHAYQTAHPTPWLPGRVGTPGNVANTTSHATAGSLVTACSPCHGSALDGVGAVAPSCMSASPVAGIVCHATSPAQKPTGCTSCHVAAPGGPNGATAPNRTFAHAKHALGLNLACAVCHGSADYGMASHANGTIDLRLSSTYQANFNVNVTFFGFNAADHTCSGVSCHGGQTTPSWQATNSITMATDCQKCHELGTGTSPGTPQNNSYYSGRHQNHLTGLDNTIYKAKTSLNIACTDCHNLTTLAPQHFLGLDTKGYAGNPPGNTVGGGTTKITSYTTGGCTNSCHVGGEGGW